MTMGLSTQPVRDKLRAGTRGERPILFSGTMVRALLSGMKTQTRRLVRLHDDGVSYDRCRYGFPGTRLWVRERLHRDAKLQWRYSADHEPVRVHQTDTAPPALAFDRPLCPGMFMPRWASRLTLEVMGIRVERLQDITEADAKAEGGGFDDTDGAWPPGRQYPCVACSGSANGIPELCHPIARGKPYGCAFARVWDAINGKRGPWQENPWVWVVSFRRIP